MLNQIKKIFSSFWLTQTIYMWLKEKKKQRFLKRLHRIAPEVVLKLQSILEDSEVFFFFDMGTLLGIVREGKLLSHDSDIDIGVRVNNKAEQERLQNYLIDNGCKLIKSCFANEINIFAQSYILNTIKFDIAYYMSNGQEDYCYLIVPQHVKSYGENDRALVKLHCSLIKEIEKRQFNGREVNCPQNSEEYLEERYGKNWRIPDKNYKYWTGPSTSPCMFHGFVKTE